MKVTRFPQSCILIEKDGQKLVIDPGDVFLKTHTVEDLQGVSAVLYTHQHRDHYEPIIAEELKKQGVTIYANDSTAKLIGEGCVTVTDGQRFEVAGFQITARELPHCLLPDGSEGPQNTGYLIDGVFFHPGDGVELEGLEVKNLALPIAGPDISFKDAFSFARQVGAELVIPMHYDVYTADPNLFKTYAEDRFHFPFKVCILGDGESVEL